MRGFASSAPPARTPPRFPNRTPNSEQRFHLSDWRVNEALK